jgi:hypothetical protein
MTATTPALSISINVRNVKTLQLRIGQGSNLTSYQDYADWALAALYP